MIAITNNMMEQIIKITQIVSLLATTTIITIILTYKEMSIITTITLVQVTFQHPNRGRISQNKRHSFLR